MAKYQLHYVPHFILCSHLHYVMLCLTNVNVNDPPTCFYSFCKVSDVERSYRIIYGFDLSITCTRTALVTPNHYFFVTVYLCIPVAGFDTTFDRHLSLLGCFCYLHLVK